MRFNGFSSRESGTVAVAVKAGQRSPKRRFRFAMEMIEDVSEFNAAPNEAHAALRHCSQQHLSAFIDGCDVAQIDDARPTVQFPAPALPGGPPFRDPWTAQLTAQNPSLLAV